MNKTKRFSIIDRIKSFKYAFNGLKTLFRTEHNARIHFFSACVAILAAWHFRVSNLEWFMILMAIAFVFSMELINSALEYLADAVSQDRNQLIGSAKDLAAGSVLVASIFALIVAIVVFAPYVVELLNGLS